ncbi:heavy-metal-associated domain-containing protein [Staphylococcus pasteuri]|nr:heavy-metal-associated domain-containing protein [Staphylococcus pasteuri]MBM6507819.1 heavy-metal-associated domain-containing protein [Staphylococcus pasteuri]QQN55205.1 heavy-metal-associated domain-containing protein [Staphylococcus pasteuri]QQT12269.1 heavy-metal-associated domain-containing protein [Staphylococcus pasteuri]QQT21517.1 heavy-metal-associated domain-containing protein [Staphylococcus pasteuri]
METILKEMIGVYDANVDLSNGHISVEFETPANLNSIEKEIYDSGFKVLY